MKRNNLYQILIVAIVLFIGIYVSRAIAKNEYISRLNKIEMVKDSLDTQVDLIKKELQLKDELLEQQIEASKKVIIELSERIEGSEDILEEYERQIDEIINQL